MCFGHLAKVAVKSYMFSCEAIGKVPPKDSNLSGCRRKDRSEPLYRQRKANTAGSFGLESLKVSAPAYDLAALGNGSTGPGVPLLWQSSLDYRGGTLGMRAQC